MDQKSNSTLPEVKKTASNRKPIIIATALTLLFMVLVTGSVSVAYLVGKNTHSTIEKQRQTIVQEGEVIANVAQEVGPSVVSIVTKQQASRDSLYFGQRTRTSQAAGTGVVIDKNGLILTNKHVVPESTSTVEVVMSDGTKYSEVEVVGRDPLNDLAILKVKDPRNFQPAKLADSDSVRVGQKVIAIGNALGQFKNTVTSGIISGVGRPVTAGNESGGGTEQLTNLFQTDAAINSGNSGGPLLNFNGEVIGINTAVAADAQNIGFAIPINEAKGIIASVQETGRLTRPYMGVRYIMLTPDIAAELEVSVKQGAYISRDADAIVSGGPADKAGVESGDIITKVNTVVLSDSVSLASAVGRFKVGETVQVTVIRDGKEKQLSVTLSENPAN
jgi:serine protease Do